MRKNLLAGLAVLLILSACEKEDDTPQEPTCTVSGPISIDTGASHFALPTGFTPNGDGINDLFFAFTEKIDTAGFSLRVLEGSYVHFAATDPYFSWAPGQFIGQRKTFDVEVIFRTQQGVTIETCNSLTIPKVDSFFTCAEDIGGLYFPDQVNITNGKFEYETAEQECP